ncbi:MAG TPA: type II toxin-antitoxin system RelE/ParE family toxin [Acidobacteriaceae bacterium]|nr:type II toxin-antitoxin system RelE/ParE family toxin [Acidobacteriaceae bacterium]
MKIRNVLHKGLRRLYEDDSPRGVPAAAAEKLRKQLAFLEGMRKAEELKALRLWAAHPLAGARDGTWSLTVTRNLRLTFRIDAEQDELCDVNLEDYH